MKTVLVVIMKNNSTIINIPDDILDEESLRRVISKSVLEIDKLLGYRDGGINLESRLDSLSEQIIELKNQYNEVLKKLDATESETTRTVRSLRALINREHF